MTTRTAETSPFLIARVAGFLYLLVIPLGIFGALYVPSKLIVPGNAAATARNLVASESLFRLGKEDLLFIKELLESGKVVPVIDRRYSLRETAEAIRYLETLHARGKVIINVEPPTQS